MQVRPGFAPEWLPSGAFDELLTPPPSGWGSVPPLIPRLSVVSVAAPIRMKEEAEESADGSKP